MHFEHALCQKRTCGFEDPPPTHVRIRRQCQRNRKEIDFPPMFGSRNVLSRSAVLSAGMCGWMRSLPSLLSTTLTLSELFSPFEIQNDAIFESALRGRTRVPSRKKQWCTSAISRLPSAEPTWRRTPVFTIPN
ncbi:hypothetical protein CDAR_57871 [Caerostris darwini]|uniref:Uncharacterized protein n=1 Tax=Caerostris darwini TaxID=1538125 RepID=A0AAV4SZ32_9ARAC|nr:hypothetical protein CDAR_57871 [Caerostris darwini]